MPSLHMQCQLIIILEFPPTGAYRAVEHGLRHIINERIDQVPQPLQRHRLLLIRHIHYLVQLVPQVCQDLIQLLDGVSAPVIVVLDHIVDGLCRHL